MRKFQQDLFSLPLNIAELGSYSAFCKSLDLDPSTCLPDQFGSAIASWGGKNILTPIKTLSLFSGVGGLDIAFHDAGFRINCALEIDERFATTLQSNTVAGGYLDGTEILCQDIRQFQPSQSEKIDFIIGGPPCQSFSAAGRRAAGVQGTQDQRGSLFEEYARILKILKPKGFLFENVYGITGAEGGRAWLSIQKAFRDAGYFLSFRILDAADYGVPQHRERMFIVGTRDEIFQFPAPTHGPDSLDDIPQICAERAIFGAGVTDQERIAKIKGRFGHLLEQIPSGLNYSFFTEKMGHPNPIFGWRSKFSDFLYKADPDVPIRTLKAQGGQYTGPFHWDNRPFSIQELKRLQTIPDKYIINGSRQVAIHQIGNSVAPQLARILALSILEQIFKIVLPSKIPVLQSNEVLSFRKRKKGLTVGYRNKALSAIKILEFISPVAERSICRTEKASIDAKFNWTQPDENGELHVQIILDPLCWTFKVNTSIRSSATSVFEIIISSRTNREWVLGPKKVKLIGGSLEGNIFVGLWKAFEAELMRQNVKADLVQLCEYYQYEPAFNCQMVLPEIHDERWGVLRKLVEGVGTRNILSKSQLAKLWSCNERKILDLMQWLKLCGFEARNFNTNPQIPKDSYLVPYAFPTLNPMSVQLRKKLLVGNINHVSKT